MENEKTSVSSKIFSSSFWANVLVFAMGVLLPIVVIIKFKQTTERAQAVVAVFALLPIWMSAYYASKAQKASVIKALAFVGIVGACFLIWGERAY